MPNVADRPTEHIYSAEVHWDVATGLLLAVRGGMIDFRPLSDGLGSASPLPGGVREWDHDVYRAEGSIGYRLSRNLGVLLSGFWQTQEEGNDADSTFAGLRLWWGF